MNIIPKIINTFAAVFILFFLLVIIIFVTAVNNYSNNFCYCQVIGNNYCYNCSMIDFKTRLRELRTEKDLRQQDLAQMLNMSKMAISHWESGHSEPSISQLITLANFFDVTVDYLICNEK